MVQWLEKHLGRYAIPNLSLCIAIIQVFGYLLFTINSNLYNYITLDPYQILHGQVWRLVTWVVVPPQSSNIAFVAIAIFFYYSIGTSLERVWGNARYNIYILGGIVFTILGAFVSYGAAYLLYGSSWLEYLAQWIAYFFTTYYVLMSIFLAYAATFPDAIVLFMFILPIRVKWLGVLYAAGMIYDIYRYHSILGDLVPIWIVAAAMASSLLNFLIFFLQTRDWKRYSPQEVHRRNQWKRDTGKTINGKWRDIPNGQNKTGRYSGAGNAAGGSAGAAGPVHMQGTQIIHKCAICGRTDQTNPELEFRYCSKCQGGYEFCQDHLFTHEHAANGQGPRVNQ